MLSKAELKVATGAGCVLVVAALTAATLAPQPVVVRSAADTAAVTPAPVVAPRPTPTPARTRPQASTVVRGPVAPAPPLTGCPTRKRPPSPSSQHTPKPRAAPVVAEAALPAPLPVRGKATSLDAVRGKGLWVTPWVKTDVDVPTLVAQAKRSGARSLWIRSGGTRQGYYGDHFLGQLVPEAHAAGLAVIAWDFPFLSDPVADARRAQQALATGIDAFSPDVETQAEGTYATARRVALYLSLVRRYAGNRPVVATVPRPTKQRATFPYRAFVPYADVFAPMVYWSCKEPGKVVQESLTSLGGLLPVAPIGQAYDMGNEGGRTGRPSRLETLRFLDAARRGGALGASLWTVEEAGAGQLQALSDYAWP